MKDFSNNNKWYPRSENKISLVENKQEQDKIVKKLGLVFVCKICKKKKHTRMESSDKGICISCKN
jgi:ribosomal protein L44E